MDTVVRRWLGEGSQSEAASDEQNQRLSDLIRCLETRLSLHHFLHHELGVVEAAGQLLAAAKLLQQRQLVGAEFPLLVNVGDGAHERTQDELGVVLAGRWGGGGDKNQQSQQRAKCTPEPRRSLWLRASLTLKKLI